MRDVKRNSEQKDFAPAGHWEVSKTTWDDLMMLPYFRNLYVTYTRPDVTDDANKKALGSLIDDETLKAFIEARVGAPIVVIDAISVVEKYNKTAKRWNMLTYRVLTKELWFIFQMVLLVMSNAVSLSIWKRREREQLCMTVDAL